MPNSEDLAALARDLLAQPPAAAAYNRRLLDPSFDGSGTLTITHDQLADAVRRVMQCHAPAIVQGVWAVLKAEAARQATVEKAARLTRIDADWRVQRQVELEEVFAGEGA